jgi:hypothetical protein
MPQTPIDKETFRKRFFQGFYDPAFDTMKRELDRALELAWNAYEEGTQGARDMPCRPRTRRGRRFAIRDPGERRRVQ